MGHDHKKKDLNGFLMELLQSVEVGYHTIFIIPTTMMEGIWLVPDSINPIGRALKNLPRDRFKFCVN